MMYNIHGDNMIRPMTMQELKQIYVEHMMNDFPDDERKPLSVIQSRYKKKENICICYLEDGLMKGYSILESCEKNKSLLMDYFAVYPEHRNQGTGTRFLQEMKEYFQYWDALLIESETAITDQAKQRIKFYQKSGVEISGVRVHLYHVDYEILGLSLHRRIYHEEIKEIMVQIYDKIYPKPFQKFYLKWI